MLWGSSNILRVIFLNLLLLIPVLSMTKRPAVHRGMPIVVADIFLLPFSLDVLILLHLGNALGVCATCLRKYTTIHAIHGHVVPMILPTSILILTLAVHTLHIKVATIKAIG